MEHVFFTPFKGSNYDQGICGKKVLVLGASFYCNQDGKNGRPKCKYFEECTDPEKKDSSKFNEICPCYVNMEEQTTLKQEPTNSVWSYMRAYKNFAKVLYPFLDNIERPDGWCDYDIVWERVAFTNYVQFFLPTKDTYQYYLSKRDFDAFCENLKVLKPNVVIAWGVAISEELCGNNPFVSKDEIKRLPDSDYYVWHMRLHEVPHDITIINCYHPSSKKWNDEEDRNLFVKYLHEIFDNNKI